MIYIQEFSFYSPRDNFKIEPFCRIFYCRRTGIGYCEVKIGLELPDGVQKSGLDTG
jgi:hypothetical protein